MHERILLCDDDALAAALMASALRDAGFNVTEVTSVDQCMSAVSAGRHDRALLDVMMPPGSLEWQESGGRPIEP